MSRHLDAAIDTLERDPYAPTTSEAARRLYPDGWVLHPQQHGSWTYAMTGVDTDQCWRCRRFGKEVTLQPATDLCYDCRLYLAEVSDDDPSPGGDDLEMAQAIAAYLAQTSREGGW